MQITSKMEPINGNLTSSAASAATEPMSHVSAEQVSGAFCHTFYVTLSENRGLITKFFGHESIFNFDGQIVTGAGEIAKLYNSLPESTHFKIHSIKGLPTLHKQGILITVVGSVNFRPFTQTFVLGQQGQKKYYVEIDNFQYLDNSFEFKTEQQQAAPEKAPATNGHQANGKVSKKAAEPVVEPPVKQSPQKPQQTPEKAEEPKVKPETPKEVVKSPKPQAQAPQPKQQAPAPIQEPVQVHVPAPAPVPQEQPKRTWATLVGGGKQQPPQQQSYGAAQQLHQQQIHRMQQAALQQHQQQQAALFQQQQQQQQRGPQDSAPHKPDSESLNLTERKIYLGGITREIVPSNTAQAETEIKQVFYKYGEVEEVRMPRKVLDSPNDTSKHAFAFITMRSKQGVQAIFAGATRDENGVWKLPLKLDAFGFDGLAQISEQRDPPSGGGFRGGRGGGGFQPRGGGGGGGQFFRRGGQGGGPRGGRGGFQNGQH